jgi:hypothetical protein
MLSIAATEDIHRRWPIYPNALVKPEETPKSVGRRLLDSGATRVDGLVLARRSWGS